jgi:hypothetical protein
MDAASINANFANPTQKKSKATGNYSHYMTQTTQHRSWATLHDNLDKNSSRLKTRQRRGEIL